MVKQKKVRWLGILMVGLLTVGMTTYAADTTEENKAASYGIEDTGHYEVKTNRHTQYTDIQVAVNTLSTDGFEEKLNNGTLSVWYNKDLEALRIVDLRSGYVWGCLDDKEEYGLNKKWSARSTAMCYVTYFNRDGKEEGAAISESVFHTDYKWEKDEFTCKVSAKKLKISFSFQVSIKEDKLTFSMDDSSIKETGKTKLSKVNFLQFFGSVCEDATPGYVFVPDGSGALIRFQKAKSYQKGYTRKVYGNDLGIDKDTTLSNLNGNRSDDYATDEHMVSFPIWGMVHGENQNAFLATIDSGELYATLNAIPAGAENRTVKFTRAYAEFIYRSQYNKRISNSKVIAMPQENLNEVNPKLTYTFLTGEDADYSGMAQEYRTQLEANNQLPDNDKKEEEDIPLFLHVAGSEVKKGFLSNGVAALTTAEEAKNIAGELKKSDINNVLLCLSGWNKGGYHGAEYGTLKFEKEVGSQKELLELKKLMEAQGGSFALTMDVMRVNEDQIQINRDGALDATLDSIKTTIPNKGLMYQDTYFVRHSLITKNLKNAFAKLDDFQLQLEGLGKYLYSDYTIRDEATRKEAQAAYVEELEESGQKVLLDGENLYLLKYASAFTDVPVSSSQYVYETDSVPFLQMVLHGSADLYAPYANLGFYSNASVLKMIEYGVSPSFMVMAADNFTLNDTPLENYFSLNYQDWEGRIQEVYGKVNEALKSVKDARIDSHEAVSEGVYCTTYDNGISIYVNYNQEEAVTESGIQIPAGGYALEGGR